MQKLDFGDTSWNFLIRNRCSNYLYLPCFDILFFVKHYKSDFVKIKSIVFTSAQYKSNFLIRANLNLPNQEYGSINSKVQAIKNIFWLLSHVLVAKQASIQTFYYFKMDRKHQGIHTLCRCPLDITDKIIIKTPPGPKA